MSVSSLSGAYLYYAATQTRDEQIGAGATIKYRMTTRKVKQRARTERSDLNACIFSKKFADSPACECGRDDETVLQMLLYWDRYVEARKILRQVTGDRRGDASYLLRGWSSRKNVETGKSMDNPRGSRQPDVEVVGASIRFLYQTGRLSRVSDMRVS
jgi:hypothetical protein